MTRPKDPGGEKVRADIGSEEWAKRWRLELQSITNNCPKEAIRFLEYYRVGQKHSAWGLLQDGNGRKFARFADFVAAPQPWGLGSESIEAIVPLMMAAMLLAMGESDDPIGMLHVTLEMFRDEMLASLEAEKQQN